MKYCEKCGKELFDEAVLCMGCGCPVAGASRMVSAPRQDDSLDHHVWNAATTNIVALIILVIGIVLGLFVNGYLGAAACLIAELVALVPNSKFQKAVKGMNWKLSKVEIKIKAKESQKSLKARYPAYRFSFVIVYVALVCLIILATGVYQFVL